MESRSAEISRLLAGIATLTAGGLIAGGCAVGRSSAAEGQTEPAIQIHRISSSQQIDLPLARYISTPADEEAYDEAVNVEQKRCAAEFGVTTTLPVAEQPSELELDTARRYGVVNPSEVARYGYKLPPTMAGSEDDKAHGWNPSSREFVVMNGAQPDGSPATVDPVSGKKLPKGGCSAEGARALDKGQTPPPRNDLVENLLGQAWNLTIADSRALTAAKKWSSCMAKHGYDFKHRWDAGNSVGTASQDVQITMAKLDLSCATQTGYIDVWYAVDSAYQQRLINDHQGELEATLGDHRAVMARVNAALQGR